jgi:hypothetical protein
VLLMIVFDGDRAAVIPLPGWDYSKNQVWLLI